MPDETRADAGRRFAHDLRSLREKRGLSLDEVHSQTRIPRPLIASFEEDGLLDHPMFNRVYLRSFVRTYAGLLALPPEAALEALDAALDGRYDGGLMRQAPSTASPPPAQEDRASGADEERPAGAAAPEAASVGEAAAEEPAPAESPAAPPPLPEDEAPDAAWSEQSPPGGSAPRRSSSRGRRPSGRLTWIGGGVAVLLVLGAAAFFLARALGSGEATAPVDTEPPAPPADTAGHPQASVAPRANLNLGETMYFTVLADKGRVSPIRITRDSDLRRPYWLEEGRATVFPAENRIVLEQQLDSIRLFLNGYPFPTSRRDEEGRIVVDRQVAQAFADTVRGAPVRLATTPDTNRIPARR